MSILGRPSPETAPAAEISSLVRPRIDGRVSSYFEWLGAVAYEVHRRGETMHRTDVPVSMVHYGVSLERLYVRVDFRSGLIDPAMVGDEVVIETRRPKRRRLLVPMATRGQPPSLEDLESGARSDPGDGTVAVDEILEAGLLWEALGAAEGERVEFSVKLLKDGNQLACWPMTGAFAVVVPGGEFTKQMWSV